MSALEQPMYEIHTFSLTDIHVPPGRTLRDKTNVEALAKSIREIGLQTPIAVRMCDNVVMDGAEFDGVPVLVAGLTRLEALKLNGAEKAPCYIIKGDEDDAALWECDENLARSDLTAGERSAYEVKRIEAAVRKAEKAKVSTNLVDSSKPKRVKGQRSTTTREDYVRETAKATGRPATSIRRALERGEKIAPDVLQAIKRTKHDTGVTLDALKTLLKPEEQHQALARMDDLGETAKQAVAFIKGEDEPPPAKAKPRNPLIVAWESASEDERREFDAYRAARDGGRDG